MRVVTGAQAITSASTSGSGKISGLSISCAANATYDIYGKILFTTSVSGQVVVLGFQYGAGNGVVSAGAMEMRGMTSALIAGTGDGFLAANINRGYITQVAMSAVATAQLSLSTGASGNTPAMVEITGLLNIAASACTLQLMAWGAAAAPGIIQIMAGSFLRAFKIP